MGKDQDPSDQKKPSQFNSYLKYSSLAIQLVFTIGLAGWLGYLLDSYLEFKYPVFIIVFTMGSFSGVVYKMYRSLNQDNE